MQAVDEKIHSQAPEPPSNESSGKKQDILERIYGGELDPVQYRRMWLALHTCGDIETVLSPEDTDSFWSSLAKAEQLSINNDSSASKSDSASSRPNGEVFSDRNSSRGVGNVPNPRVDYISSTANAGTSTGKPALISIFSESEKFPVSFVPVTLYILFTLNNFFVV